MKHRNMILFLLLVILGAGWACMSSFADSALQGGETFSINEETKQRMIHALNFLQQHPEQYQQMPYFTRKEASNNKSVKIPITVILPDGQTVQKETAVQKDVDEYLFEKYMQDDHYLALLTVLVYPQATESSEERATNNQQYHFERSADNENGYPFFWSYQYADGKVYLNIDVFCREQLPNRAEVILEEMISAIESYETNSILF